MAKSLFRERNSKNQRRLSILAAGWGRVWTSPSAAAAAVVGVAAKEPEGPAGTSLQLIRVQASRLAGARYLDTFP